MASYDDEVRVWDEHGAEKDRYEAEAWDDWDKCAAAPGFPKGLVMFLRDKTRGCGFERPSLIQTYAWPALVTGQDLIGVAKTGSGKTLAFLLPGFMWLKKNRKTDDPVDTSVGPAILCLTPTRELCYQIYSDADKFGAPVKISAAFAYGGAPKWEQEKSFGENPDVLIATPGRLADFLREGKIRLSQARYSVLDEADRMLDMGFEPQVKEILDYLPKNRQMSMFTATFPASIRKLAEKYINKPLQVQVGSLNMAANADVDQHFEFVNSDGEKKDALKRITKERKGSMLIFCNTKKKCRDLAWELSPDAVELHGDLNQQQRDASMSKFKAGEVTVLVATDVAARGLDMRSITVVVNYDAPNNCSEDYVHRIGRTGRAGDKGDAYTFLTWGDETKAADIAKVLKNGGGEVPEVLSNLANGKHQTGSGSSWGGGGGGDDWKKDSGGSSSSDEKRINRDDKSKTPYTYQDFMDFNKGDKKKADKMWEESDPVPGEDTGGSASSDEKRIHKDDKSKAPYTYQDFVDFNKGDKKKADKMWGESEPVAGEDEPKKEDKWWEKDDAKKDKKEDTTKKAEDAVVDKWWEKEDSKKVEKEDKKDEPAKEEAKTDKWWEKKDGDEDMEEDKDSKKGDDDAAAAEDEDFGDAVPGTPDEGGADDKKRAADEDADSPPAAKKGRTDDAADSPGGGAAAAGDDEAMDEIKEMVLGGQTAKLTITKLKAFLKSRGKATDGIKKELLERATLAALS